MNRKKIFEYIVGIDEVGRGPIAGSVYVCAAMMRIKEYKKQKWKLGKLELADSKKLSRNGREIWFQKAIEFQKQGILVFAIARKSPAYIDRYGISPAIKGCITELLEKLAIDSSRTRIELDGSLYAPAIYKNQKTFTKGDLKRKIISLASVIAKVSRDRYMTVQHKKNPLYGWDENKGYGTRIHYSKIGEFGTSKLHRKTFIKTY